VIRKYYATFAIEFVNIYAGVNRFDAYPMLNGFVERGFLINR
jgi:hypothetical protein